MNDTEPENQEHEEILFQYDKLRAEILHNDTIGLQLFGATLLLISAAMGFAVQEKTGDILRIWVFFGAICLLFISMYQTIHRISNTFLIASYMRVFLEEKTKHIKWESRLKKFREEKPDENYNPFPSLLTTYVIIAFANLILIVFYTFRTSNNDKHLAVFLAIISFIVWLIMVGVEYFLYNKYVRKEEETYQKTWEKIRDHKKANGQEAS